MTAAYVRVAVPLPVDGLYTYRLPEGATASPGVRVEVRFGHQRLVGLVVEGPTDVLEGLDPGKVRPLQRVLDKTPLLPPDVMALAGWMREYYHVPPGEAYLKPLPPAMGGGRGKQVKETHRFKEEEVVRAVNEPATGVRLGSKMDAALTWLGTVEEATMAEVRAATGASRNTVLRLRDRGFVALRVREVLRDPFKHIKVAPDTPPTLNAAQSAAVEQIVAALGTYRGFLLDGITGSGKTEVYLAAIQAALARDEGALVLVPEIALTPQLVSRFRARLGDRVAVQHSALDPAARREQWVRIASGELPVVIGARSALFAPVRRVGVIVVDEEHEPSYKQDVSPRYHARDLALVRGHLSGVPVVLGSATPSLESWANQARGKLTHIRLPERVQSRPLPEVSLVDMRDAAHVGERGVLSSELVDAMAETLERGEQVILFLNRRGYAPSLSCTACGEAVQCASCSVSMTWHRARRRLVCHYCDEVEPLPERCPNCASDGLKEVGAGTEHVETQLHALFRSARIARMDRDTTRGHSMAKLLGAFRDGEIDILIGTQIVAKGHDFPNVTLVGVLLAEQSLAFPDFRATERTFQLLTQIAGRAGRAEKPGRVLVQTYMPEHYVLGFATRHDSHGVLSEELSRRSDRGFPPWTSLAVYKIDGPDADAAWRFAEAVAQCARQAARSAGLSPDGLRFTGPHVAPIERLKERYRFQFLLTARDRGALQRVLNLLVAELAGLKRPPKLRVALDVDPVTFL